MVMRRPPSARALSLGVVLCTGLLGGFLTSKPTRAGDTAAGPRTVRIVPLEGTPLEGAFLGIDAKGLRIEGREAPLALDSILEVRFAPDVPVAPLPEGTAGVRAVLRGGEILRGVPDSGDAEALALRTVGLGTLKIPFDAILRVEAESSARGPCDDPTRERPPRKGADLAYAKSGDAFPGTLLAADATGLTLESGHDKADKHALKWADLVLLQLDESALPAAEGLVVEVDTLGGSRLVTTAITADAAALTLKTRSGIAVSVPLEAITVLRFAGGRFVYASDLPFTSVYTHYYGDNLEEKAYHEAFYGARVDRTSHDCPLRVLGTTYRHGIAVHAKSVVTVPLGKGFSTFHALIGIDDEAMAKSAPTHGDVTARVLADGKEAWSSAGSIVGGVAPKRIGPLDVTGVTSLVLEVDFGGDLYRMDRADWLDPVLVRAK